MRKPETSRVLKHFVILKFKEIVLPILALVGLVGLIILPGFLLLGENIGESCLKEVIDNNGFGRRYGENCAETLSLSYTLTALVLGALSWVGILFLLYLIYTIILFLTDNWSRAKKLANKEIKKEIRRSTNRCGSDD